VPDALKIPIPYEEARAALDATPDALPADLRGRTSTDIEASWGEWVSRHNADIRARLARGDEDSIVNLWQFGTSFTRLPRISERDLAGLSRRVNPEDLLIGRLDDFVAALAEPSSNDRLRFARQVLERHGIDVTQPAGQDAARIFLAGIRARAIAEHESYRRALRAATDREGSDAATSVFATLYRDRGLSSDTSIRVDFALDQAIEAGVADGHLRTGGVRRVAIVGPGLDFTDKAEGYDFYPQQTVQPFAIVDSLLRHGASSSGDLQVTTFDLSPRINHHLESARARAEAGQAYVLQLPLDRDWPGHHWRPIVQEYWQQMGSQIGDNVPPVPLPSDALNVRMRAVGVRPAVVTSIVPRDVNIVLERLEPLAPGDRFDLVVATNILVYYDAFEQRLALVNIATMLKPGGSFLTNYRVAPLPPMEPSPSLVTAATWDDRGNGDSLFWYRRR
jgi:SAM-dependent methyltransferase